MRTALAGAPPVAPLPATAPRPGRDRPRRRVSARLVVVAMVTAGLLATAAGASAATITVRGTVRDDAGRAVPDAPVTVHSGSSAGYGGDDHTATTDAAGRYAIDDVPAWGSRPSPSYSFTVALTDGYTEATRYGFSDLVRDVQGGTLVVDASVRRRDASLSGRVSVRGGASPEGAVVEAVAEDYETFETRAAPDGTWRVAVPPGTYRTRARSTYGLPAWAPDLPALRIDAPTVTLKHGAARSGVTVSLRARMADRAFDEYGTLQDGYGSSSGGAPGTYPVDPHRTILSHEGPHAWIGAYPTTIVRGDDFAYVQVTNDGDDDVFTGPVRFEGGVPFECSGTSTDDGTCGRAYALPEVPLNLQIRPAGNPPARKQGYPTTVVIPTNAGELRVHVVVGAAPGQTHAAPVGPTPAENLAKAFAALVPATTTAPHAPIPRPGAGGDVGRVLMTKNRLRVTFPAAGTATSTVDRSVRRRVRGRVRRRWRTVRRLALRAERAGTQVARFPRLARGRYRVRTRYAIGTRTPRITTTTWTIRR